MASFHVLEGGFFMSITELLSQNHFDKNKTFQIAKGYIRS